MRRLATSGVVLLVAVLTLARAAAGQAPPDECVVSMLNRTTTVDSQGNWVLRNVPAAFGPIKATMVCSKDGKVTIRKSSLILVSASGDVTIREELVEDIRPAVKSIEIAADYPVFRSMNQSFALRVNALLADGIAASLEGDASLAFRSSNPSILSIDGSGVVVAKGSGVVIVQAAYEGFTTLARLQSNISGDADGDGLPDDFERANGLDPNDGSDSLSDIDRDGLSTLEEFRLGTDIHRADTDGDGLKDGDEVVRGTNPAAADTDGDLIPDGLEVLLGTNPRDPASGDLSRAIQRIEITPVSATMVVNTVAPEASVQLRVSAILVDGARLDITDTTRGTRYSSSDLTVCNFGASPGRVFAGQPGGCVIAVANGTFASAVPIRVENFTPVTKSQMSLPGALAVTVDGSYAYVVGGTLFRVVDITNRSAPRLLGTLNVAEATLQDVRVVGNTAYVAGGDAGLVVVDVANRLNPRFVKTVSTAGAALDLVIANGTRLYLAVGEAGLAIFDLDNPTDPLLQSTTHLGTDAIGVDVDAAQSIAAVALGVGGVSLVDVSNPVTPVLKGRLPGGNVRDVTFTDGTLLLADSSRSLTSVSVASVENPTIITSTAFDLGGAPVEIAVSGGFAATADTTFGAVYPIIDIIDSAQPRPRFFMNVSPPGFGTGVAMDSSFCYIIAGGSFQIGQYRALTDSDGVPPQVSITLPAPGSTVVARATVPFSVVATDDVAVSVIQLLLNGQVVGTATSSPATIPVTIPKGVDRVTLSARALDLGNNVGVSGEVGYDVIVGPLTTVIGDGVDQQGNPIGNARVSVIGEFYGQSDGNGQFSIADVPAALQALRVYGEVAVDNVVLRGRSAIVAAVADGVTKAGRMVYFPDADWDGLPDEYEASHPCLSASSRDDEADPDGDGVSTFREYELGTDPCRPNLEPGKTEGYTQLYSVWNGPLPDDQHLSSGLNQVTGGLYSMGNGNPPDANTLVPGQLEVLTNVYALWNESPDRLPAGLNETETTIYSLQNGALPDTESLPAALNQAASMIHSVRNGPDPSLVASLPPGRSEAISNTHVVDNQAARVTASLASQLPPGNSTDAASDAIRILDSIGTDSTVVLQGQTLVLRTEVSRETAQVEYSVDGVRLATASPLAEQRLLVPAILGSFQLRALARDSGGTVVGVADRTYHVFPAPPLSVSNALTGEVSVEARGLLAELFDSSVPLQQIPDVANLRFVRRQLLSSLNLQNPEGIFGLDPFGTGLHPDYAIRIGAALKVTTGGRYRFRIRTRDGARLSINGSFVAETGGGVGTEGIATGSVDLEPGQAMVEVLFYSNVGPPSLVLERAFGDGAFYPIPAEDWSAQFRTDVESSGGAAVLTAVPVWAEPVRITQP